MVPKRSRAGGRVQGHDSLPPAVADALELADRQRVEELVGDDQQGAARHRLEFVVPCGPGARQAGALRRAQGAVRFDQMQADGVTEPRNAARGAERVGEERAAARPQFDEADARRPAHAPPQDRTPEADQLTEHLAHFRRSDEIPRAADPRPAPVIAESRMRQAEAHVGGDAERPVAPDTRPERRRERGHRPARGRSGPGVGRQTR